MIDVRLRRLVAALLLLSGFGAGAARAQDEVTIRAEVDRSHVTLDDQILLVVTVEGRFRSIEEPLRPPLDDFDVFQRGRTQGMQIVNGAFTASNSFTYLLVPKREGSFTIGAFTARVGGKELKSAPIAITVGGGPGVRGAPAPAPGEPEEREDRDVFVVARIDKERAYVNEQILYTFYLYRAVNLSNLNYTAPGFQGFWVEKLKDSEKQSYKMINGRRFLVTELATAIFPTTSGKLSIDAATLQLVVLNNPFGFSLFERGVERVLRTRPLEVQVAPLPAGGKPSIFEGAVGEGLTLSARADRTEVEAGEPITLSVAVEGSGNVKTFSKPRLPELPQFKTYDGSSKTEVQSADRVFGTQRYEIVVVPKDEGEYTIGPIRLAYFDTREAKYRVLETKPIAITAVKSSDPSRVAAADQPIAQQDIEVTGRDIAHIRPDLRVADDLVPLYARGGFAVLVPVPLLAVIGVALRQRRRQRFASDVALARATRARKLARKHLAAAAKHLQVGAAEAFYAETSRALLHFAGDKLNVAAAGLTHATLRARLDAAGVEVPVTERLVQLLERCDAARFAPGSGTGERLRETLAEAEALLVELDGALSRRGTRRAATAPIATLAVLVAGLAVSAVTIARAQEPAPPPPAPASAGLESPEQLLRQGHAAYEAGDFAAAADLYRRAEAAGVRTAALYYDLGNACFKNAELGRAIAAYRRAENLAPRDAEVRRNLDYARERREDRTVQPPAMPLVGAWRALLKSLSLNEWVAMTAGLYALVCAILVAGLLGYRGAVVRGAQTACLALVAAAMLFTGFKIRAERGTHHGVVGVSRVAVTSGPGANYTTEFSLHEGAEVRIEDRRTDWLRVSVGERLHGWVPAASVLPI